MYDAFFLGLHAIANLEVQFFILFGAVAGIAVSCLPGLSATMAVALLLPLTFGISPVSALLLLSGIYVGAMFGGAIPAILLATPGTPSAVSTTFDGYPMAKKGMAGKAISIACIASDSFSWSVSGDRSLIDKPYLMFFLSASMSSMTAFTCVKRGSHASTECCNMATRVLADASWGPGSA